MNIRIYLIAALCGLAFIVTGCATETETAVPENEYIIRDLGNGKLTVTPSAEDPTMDPDTSDTERKNPKKPKKPKKRPGLKTCTHMCANGAVVICRVPKQVSCSAACNESDCSGDGPIYTPAPAPLPK